MVYAISPFLPKKIDIHFIHGRRAPKFPTMDPAVFGALAGLAFDSATSPLLRTRTIQAVGDSPEYNGMIKTLRYIVRVEGVKGLYRGLAPLAVLGPVGTGIFFYTHDKVKKWGPDSDLVHFLRGVFGQLAGAAAWVPCATISETRFLTEAQAKGLYALNARGIVKHIAKNKGILGFYPAFWSHNAGYCFFNGAGTVASEKMIHWLKEKRGRNLHPSEIALAHLAGFGFAAAVSSPIATFAIYYQTQSVASSTAKSVLKTLGQMFKERGIGRFWDGTITRILTLAPRSAFVFSAVHWYSERNKNASPY